jgi:hypothetical protein
MKRKWRAPVSDNLYEISTNLKLLAELSGRELSETEQEQYNDIKIHYMKKLEGKAQGIIYISKGVESDIVQIDEEMKRLKDLKNSLVKKKESLLDFLLFGMECAELSEIKTPTMIIKVGKKPDIITVNEENEVGKEFLLLPPPVKAKPDKRALLNSYKATGVVPAGCAIETNRKKINVR